MQEIVIEINPHPKPRMTKSDRWKKRAPVVKYWAFCDEIRKQCKGFSLSDSYQVVFTIPFPKSYSKKQRQLLEGAPHKQRPDLDNFVKALNDALLPEEDSGVWHIEASKLWGETGSIYIENL